MVAGAVGALGGGGLVLLWLGWGGWDRAMGWWRGLWFWFWRAPPSQRCARPKAWGAKDAPGATSHPWPLHMGGRPCGGAPRDLVRHPGIDPAISRKFFACPTAGLSATVGVGLRGGVGGGGCTPAQPNAAAPQRSPTPLRPCVAPRCCAPAQPHVAAPLRSPTPLHPYAAPRCCAPAQPHAAAPLRSPTLLRPRAAPRCCAPAQPHAAAPLRSSTLRPCTAPCYTFAQRTT